MARRMVSFVAGYVIGTIITVVVCALLLAIYEHADWAMELWVHYVRKRK